jgi:hypothetical protein
MRASRLCYSASHHETELTPLSHSAFASFGVYQQSIASSALGFQVPARDFGKKASDLMSSESSRQGLAADHVLKSAIKEWLMHVDNAQRSEYSHKDPKRMKAKPHVYQRLEA